MKKWKVQTDGKLIKKVLDEFFVQVEDPTLSVRDRKMYVLYPEKKIEVTPLKFIKNKIIFYSSEEVSKGKCGLSFFLKKKRLYFSIQIEIFSIDKNRFYFLSPKEVKYFKTNEILFIPNSLRRYFPVSFGEEQGPSLDENMGFLVDISPLGLRVYTDNNSFVPGDVLPYVSIGMFSYISLGIKDLKVVERKGLFVLALFSPDNVSFHVSEKDFLDDKKKKKLKNYVLNFRFQHFLDNYFVPELRRMETKMIAKSKEEQEEIEEREEFYFNKKREEQGREKEIEIKRILVVDLPINGELSDKLKKLKQVEIIHYSNKIPPLNELKETTLVCVDFRILQKKICLFKPFAYKTVIMFDTTQAARVPKLIKAYAFIGAFSYSQAKIYTEKQIVSAFLSMIKPSV